MSQNLPDRTVVGLAVDDDALIRMDVVATLEDAGFVAVEAANADEAVSFLIGHHHETVVLFTDVDMPGSMDGFGLARRVAASWPHIDILVASGRRKPDPGDMPEKAVFVNKPFGPEVVIARLHELLPDHKKPASLLRINRPSQG